MVVPRESRSGMPEIDNGPRGGTVVGHRALVLCLAPLDSAWRPRQWPTVLRMLPTCASMWAIRPLVMSCSVVIGGASVKTVPLVAS